MNKTIKLGCLVMAAGNASRFGKNKLLSLLDGRTLIEHALSAVPDDRFARVVVVTQYPEVEQLAVQRGFTVVRNEHLEWGLSYTVRLGTEALAAQCDAILYQVADQPRLQRESVGQEIDFFLTHPDQIVCMGSEGKRGNPCIFPRRFFSELMALQGDVGGSAVIRRHEDCVLLFDVNARQLADVDTPEALHALNE